ncbi:hypothetical protein VPH35_084224 [Triticum aestivum]
MDQGDLHRRISRIVLKIRIDDLFLHGYVADCDAHSATVVACSKNIPVSLVNCTVTLVFPDGRKFSPNKHDIKIWDNVASIQCYFPGDVLNTNLVQSLEVCRTPLLMSENIYTYSAYEGDYTGIITPGYLISIHENYFHHNSCANIYSGDGALVINKNGELVGLCCDFNRYLISMDVPAILEVLENQQ